MANFCGCPLWMAPKYDVCVLFVGRKESKFGYFFIETTKLFGN